MNPREIHDETEGDAAAAGVTDEVEWCDVSIEERAAIRRAMRRQGRHPDIEILKLNHTASSRGFQANFLHGPGQQRGATAEEAERKLFRELYYRGEVGQKLIGFGDVLSCGLCGENPGSCPACEGEQRMGSHACQECGGSGLCKGKAHARARR